MIFDHFLIAENLPGIYEPLILFVQVECPDPLEVQWAKLKDPAVQKNCNDFIITKMKNLHFCSLDNCASDHRQFLRDFSRGQSPIAKVSTTKS